MKEVVGDLWEVRDAEGIEAVCVLTNGIVNTNGKAAMGKGQARAALERYPKIDKALGEKISAFGNRVHVLLRPGLDFNNHAFMYYVLSFPTKRDWRDPSDLELIVRSARDLEQTLDNYKIETCIIPRPGTGLGGLSWGDVRPRISSVLSDRITVVSLPE